MSAEQVGEYTVTEQRAERRGVAAVRARISVARVPSLFAGYLDRVYAAARDGAIALDGQNIFVYWSDDPARRRTDVYYLPESFG